MHIRTGKRDVRTSAASLVNELTHIDVANTNLNFTNSDFEIGRTKQWVCLIVFFLFGVLSILTASLKIGTYTY